MLVTIQANPASADTYRTVCMNLLQAIKVVATAGAGTTPSLKALSSATNRTTTEMITVIDNTEAGGWSVGSDDNIPATPGSGTFYNSSFSSYYTLDLYNSSTNSPSYPYHKITIRTGGEGTYYFNNGWESYPYCNAWHGATTASNYSSSDWGSYAATRVTVRGGYNYPLGALYIPDYSGTTVTLAVTQNYMHLIAPNSVISMGYRETQGWETNYNDNPPVCNFHVDTRQNSQSAYYPSSCFMWARSIDNSGNFNTPLRFGQASGSNAQNGYGNPVTGSPDDAGGGSYSSITALRNYNPYNIRSSGSIATPLFILTAHQATGGAVYAPVCDNTTGALVPPAYPIIFSSYGSNQMNPGGRMMGIYKSLSTSGYWSPTLFYTANQTYVVNGENYYPAVLTGCSGQYDLFLVRRA
jgi:hypothetical protein